LEEQRTIIIALRLCFRFQPHFFVSKQQRVRDNWVENGGKISDFFTNTKLLEERAKCLSGLYKFNLVGCVAQLAERRSLAGELTLSCARPAADGWSLCG